LKGQKGEERYVGENKELERRKKEEQGKMEWKRKEDEMEEKMKEEKEGKKEEKEKEGDHGSKLQSVPLPAALDQPLHC